MTAKFTIIDDLKKAKPKKRSEVLHKMHARNVAFFKSRNHQLGEALEAMGTGGFEIRVNPEFMDIIEVSTGRMPHPAGRLLEYVETMANSHHTGWIDKLEVLHQFTGAGEHQKRVHSFLEGLYAKLPQITQRMRSGIINLPRLPDNRRFSGSTVFLGTLTGLHIVHYLNNVEVRDVMIIEPDQGKFALSCWFVDYQAIERRFGRLILHVGPDMPDSPLGFLMGTSPIVSSVWLRMLPIYPSELFDDIINRTHLRWRTFHEMVVPFDREVRNLTYGAANLRDHRPLFAKTPKLSDKSRIAVVLSGPSLDNDIEWLKKNRQELIVICAHSAVRILRRHGVTPDFQCTLDTELGDDLLEKLAMDYDVPLISYYKCDPKVLSRFKTVLLFAEAGKANAVNFGRPLTHTHPTSGNSAIAVALAMQPGELFFLGLDLGFRNAEQSHAKGSWHDDGGGAGHQQNRQAQNAIARANFPESDGQILTNAYYNYSRVAVEAAISSMAGRTKIWNLSDGVAIAGAEGRHSIDCVIEGHAALEIDLEAIRGAFVGDGEAVWQRYEVQGEAVLTEMRTALLKALAIKSVNWQELSATIDRGTSAMAAALVAKWPNDLRYEAYIKLVQDLLAEWFRVLVFTKTPAELKICYEAGVSGIEDAMSQLQWPPGLNNLGQTEAVRSMADVTVTHC